MTMIKSMVSNLQRVRLKYKYQWMKIHKFVMEHVLDSLDLQIINWLQLILLVEASDFLDSQI